MRPDRLLFVAGAAFSMSVGAIGREVDMRGFSPPESGFRLLEPGYRKGSPNAQSRATLNISALQRDDGSTSPAANPLQAQSGSATATISIPAWMKDPIRNRMPPATTMAFIPPDRPSCSSTYAPSQVLSAAQELRRQRYYGRMVAAACAAQIPVELFDALIIQESGYDPYAFSPKGAVGLTQLMPGTAHELRVYDRWDVSQNLAGGARYLRKQLATFGSWALALGAYNAGPGNITKYGGLPPFEETRGYVRNVLSNIDLHRARRSGSIYRAPAQRKITLTIFTL